MAEDGMCCLRLARVCMLMSCQFAFCASPAITCPLYHYYPTSWVSALLFSTCSHSFFFPFRAWGILLLSLTFCFIQAARHLSISVREAGCQSHRHMLSFLSYNHVLSGWCTLLGTLSGACLGYLHHLNLSSLGGG